VDGCRAWRRLAVGWPVGHPPATFQRGPETPAHRFPRPGPRRGFGRLRFGRGVAVADLAGVSVEYYAQLERGNLAGVSDSVLDTLARALRLDEAEQAHMTDLDLLLADDPSFGVGR
jgi:hypothetical protein